MAPLTGARQRLAAHNIALAHALAKPFKDAYPSIRDDLNGVAELALVECAARFDKHRGIKFSKYARVRIICSLRDELRSRPIRETSHVESLICESVADDSPPACSGVDSDDAAEHLIAGFGVQYRPLVRLIFVEGLTIEAAARRMGVLRGAVKRQLKTAIHHWAKPGTHAPREIAACA
jgi:RNA polymerase sigma factor (sigma-70 family)